jgi:hypothetical protein
MNHTAFPSSFISWFSAVLGSLGCYSYAGYYCGAYGSSTFGGGALKIASVFYFNTLRVAWIVSTL